MNDNPQFREGTTLSKISDIGWSRKVALTSVYRDPAAIDILYALLAEREPEQNVSHKAMPTFQQHANFMRDKPYLAWYLIHDAGSCVGSIYLTKAREVGIFIFKKAQGKHYGTDALAELRKLHPGRMLANINPANKKSLAFFHLHGAKLIQLTFELPEEA